MDKRQSYPIALVEVQDQDIQKSRVLWVHLWLLENRTLYKKLQVNLCAYQANQHLYNSMELIRSMLQRLMMQIVL